MILIATIITIMIKLDIDSEKINSDRMLTNVFNFIDRITNKKINDVFKIFIPAALILSVYIISIAITDINFTKQITISLATLLIGYICSTKQESSEDQIEKIWNNYKTLGITVVYILILQNIALLIIVTYQAALIKSKENNKFINNLIFILDWIPARIISGLYVLIGKFDQAIELWLDHLKDTKKTGKKVISDIAKSALDFDGENKNKTIDRMLNFLIFTLCTISILRIIH